MFGDFWLNKHNYSFLKKRNNKRVICGGPSPSRPVPHLLGWQELRNEIGDLFIEEKKRKKKEKKSEHLLAMVAERVGDAQFGNIHQSA